MSDGRMDGQMDGRTEAFAISPLHFFLSLGMIPNRMEQHYSATKRYKNRRLRTVTCLKHHLQLWVQYLSFYTRF